MTNEHLHTVLRNFGWGPKYGPVTFRRESNGWRLGNGIVVTPWYRNGKEIPSDPEQALADIEKSEAVYL